WSGPILYRGPRGSPATIGTPRASGGIWQTRRIQVPVGATPWRFKSSLAHYRVLTIRGAPWAQRPRRGRPGLSPATRRNRLLDQSGTRRPIEAVGVRARPSPYSVRSRAWDIRGPGGRRNRPRDRAP